MEPAAQTKNCVLDEVSIQRKLRRLALQVAEMNAEESELIVAGISGNGEVLAKCLLEELEKIGSLATSYTQIQLDKKEPAEVLLSPSTNFNNKVVLVVDDVANTGKTMLYALKPFLNNSPKKIQTLVLVERSHKLFPVQTDYAGLSIATTLQEHITVKTDGKKILGAWLH